MKNFLFIIGLAIMATACSSTRPATTSTPPTNTARKKSSLTFIENISVKPQSHSDETGGSYEKSGGSAKTVFYPAATIENYSSLRFKYAILLDANVEEMNNGKLLAFMENWYGTPYHYGGTSKEGIDCSAFVASLMSSVYSISSLPRMSRDQYNATRRIKRNDLQEGDLVFFHTTGKRKEVTHVGVYLRNNKFVHASVSGVMISDMNEGYYAGHYVGAGRVGDEIGNQ